MLVEKLAVKKRDVVAVYISESTYAMRYVGLIRPVSNLYLPNPSPLLALSKLPSQNIKSNC